jgi:multiple sugar transport system permease protein
MSVVWVLPIVWGFLTSFKSEREILQHSYRFLPINWVLSNYTNVLFSTSTPVLRWFTNSLFISTTHAILVIVIVSLAAYGYARLNFKWRNQLFYFLMATMMFPQIVNLIPLFAIVQRFGWINSPLSVIIPSAAGVFNVFLVRQFLLGIPKDFDESAKMDGASEFQIFTKIMLPFIKPVLTVVGMFSFVASWNDFLWPSIVFSDVRRLPLTPGLLTLQGTFHMQIGSLLAGATFALLPTFLLYLFVQKYFVESLSLSAGIKG